MKTNLIEIFQTIRAQMQPYAVEGFKVKTDSDLAYHLSTDQQHNKQHIENTEIYFFGVEVKSDYVGFYYNPIFTAKEIDLIFFPDLTSILKENDCFQITQLDNELLKSISNALKLGAKMYKQKEWG